MLGGGNDFYALSTPNITGQLELERTSGDHLVQGALVETAGSLHCCRRGWRGRLRCCSVLWMKQVRVAGLCTGAGLEFGVPILSPHTRILHQDYLSWLGQGLEQLQRWAGGCGCVYTPQHLSSRPRGGFLKVSHQACSFYTRHCCDTASPGSSCHTSVAVQSFRLHPSPSPVSDTRLGTRRG